MIDNFRLFNIIRFTGDGYKADTNRELALDKSQEGIYNKANILRTCEVDRHDKAKTISSYRRQLARVSPL